MSIKRLDTYTAVCDWPGCSADVMDPTDYSGWGEVDNVTETLADYDWHTSTTGMSHFCYEHPAVWVSEPDRPQPPYLLIHDGDTDNPDDDGRVTLVRPITEVLLDEGNVPLLDDGGDA